jgi:hypothetical protein
MRLPILFACLALAAPLCAQETAARMTQERMHAIVAEAAQEVRVQGNVVTFRLGETQVIGVSDPSADRMRFIAPIKPVDESNPEELLASMYANFHTVLDARYAISNGILFAAFLHPLSPLTREQVLSAMRQVALARETFGGAYSSGLPGFGGPR